MLTEELGISNFIKFLFVLFTRTVEVCFFTIILIMKIEIIVRSKLLRYVIQINEIVYTILISFKISPSE